MKSIIPFKKEIVFKTNLYEVVSISLENTLHITDDGVSGDFIVSGDYKMDVSSTTLEPFSFNIPFDISLINDYDISKATVDIDDFYYEIMNESILTINIDVCVDKLEKKEQDELEQLVDYELTVEPLIREAETVEDIRDNAQDSELNVIEEERVDDNIKSLFQTLDEEKYVTYKIYIVKENDTLDTIKQKYEVTMEDLEQYNDLNDFVVGNKVIIPLHEEN